MDVKPEMYPGYTDEAHPECFNKEAMPQQPTVKKPGQLPESMIKQYFEKVSHNQLLYVNNLYSVDNHCRVKL